MLFRLRDLRYLLGVMMVLQGIAILATVILAIKAHVEGTNKESTWSMHCDETDKNQLPELTNRSAVDAQWQKVDNTWQKMFAYSAFWDAPSAVLVIGAANRWHPERVWCRLWFNETCSATVAARVQFLGDHHELEYAACFITCPLEGSQVPRSVSVMKDTLDLPTNHVLVVLPAWPREPMALALCMKPFYNEFNKTLALIEFLEYHSMLGMEQFTVYAPDAADPSVHCILENYKAEGVMNLMSWDLLGLHPFDDIHCHNQVAAINDCLYRNRQRAEHVAVLDVDEFLVSREDVSLVELLSQLERDVPSGEMVGSFLFRSAFFYPKPAANGAVQTKVKRPLVTQTWTRRMEAFFPHGNRSKYICKPEGVVQGLIHYVDEHDKDYVEVPVDSDVAAVHHYRERGDDALVTGPTVDDSTALRFRSELTARVARRWNDLVKVCHL